jgi:hypothetical protein
MARLNQLHASLPFGYIKATQCLLSRSVTPPVIQTAAKTLKGSKDVKEALSWVAMEHILGKMLEMPDR